MGDDDEREPFEGIANTRLGVSGGFGKQVFAVLNRLGQGDRTSMFPGHAPYEHAFAEAFSRRFPEYIAILLAVFAVMIVDWTAGRAAAFQTYGLVFDLIGALALARRVVQGKTGLQRTTASSRAPHLSWRERKTGGRRGSRSRSERPAE